MSSRRQLLAGLGALGGVALAGCSTVASDRFAPGEDPNTDWPMPRHDPGNEAYAPDAAAPREPPTERWTYDGGFDARTPAVADGTVYVPTAEALIALDSTDGTARWRFAPDEQPWPSSPVVHDGTVYVSMVDEDSVHAVDVESGEERWSFGGDADVQAAPGLLAGDIVNEPAVLVGDANGRVAALEPDTGARRWTVDCFGSVRALAYRSPTLYVGTTSGEVYAYYADGEADGEPPSERWRRQLKGRVEAVVPTANGIAVASFGGPLVALRSGNAGAEAWTAARGRAGSAPVHTGTWFYSSGYDALSATRGYDGETGWRASVPLGSAPPVAAGDTLYAAGETSVHALALDGDGPLSGVKRWSHPVPGGGVQGLAVADGALFVARESGEENETTLYCLA